MHVDSILQGWAKNRFSVVSTQKHSVSCITYLHYLSYFIIVIILVSLLMLYLLGNDGWQFNLVFPNPVWFRPVCSLKWKREEEVVANVMGMCLGACHACELHLSYSSEWKWSWKSLRPLMQHLWKWLNSVHTDDSIVLD